MEDKKIGKNTSLAALKKRAENDKRAEVETSTPEPEADEPPPPEKTA